MRTTIPCLFTSTVPPLWCDHETLTFLLTRYSDLAHIWAHLVLDQPSAAQLSGSSHQRAQTGRTADAKEDQRRLLATGASSSTRQLPDGNRLADSRTPTSRTTCAIL
uniref:(northern house mosquito) hypothetical protein n=1 Tax=Culex pipiens TaxID=7175 RepID=A0A8D8BA58_CULPI